MPNESELIVLPEIKYEVTIESATEFAERFKEVPIFNAENGVNDEVNKKIIANSKEINKKSSSIEKLRKQFKQPSLDYGRSVDGLAKELQGILEPAKIRFSEARAEIDNYEKMEKQKLIDAEMERVRLIDVEVQKIRNAPALAIGLKSDEVLAIYENLSIPCEDVFHERTDEATLLYKDTISKIESQIETLRISEQAEETMRVEKERLNKIAQEEEAERAIKQKKLDDEIQALEEKIQALEDEERRVKEEAERVEKEKIQALEDEERRVKEEAESKEKYEERWNSACDAIEECEKKKEHILDWITEGRIPYVSWDG